MSKKYIMKNGISVVVSDEIYKILKESDRKIKYVEHDLKETRYIIDRKKETVKEIPSRKEIPRRCPKSHIKIVSQPRYTFSIGEAPLLTARPNSNKPCP